MDDVHARRTQSAPTGGQGRGWHGDYKAHAEAGRQGGRNGSREAKQRAGRAGAMARKARYQKGDGLVTGRNHAGADDGRAL